MEELYKIAEEEMINLKQPYVGSEHLLLAYLKIYNSKIISYDEFKRYVLEIIGSSYKQSEYILYTPIARKIKNSIFDVKEAILSILKDNDTIAYNILLSKGIEIDKLYEEINTSN